MRSGIRAMVTIIQKTVNQIADKLEHGILKKADTHFGRFQP
jgi:hypothetical protein